MSKTVVVLVVIVVIVIALIVTQVRYIEHEAVLVVMTVSGSNSALPRAKCRKQ